MCNENVLMVGRGAIAAHRLEWLLFFWEQRQKV